jgi:RNA polymerase sigma-70 factor (ECF subfamily)
LSVFAHLTHKAACGRIEPVAEQNQEQLDPAEVAALYLEHADPLRRFLRGVLRDPVLAHDVLQTTFAKLLEVGHTARDESRRAWLFQVAYREALAVRRRQAAGERILRQAAWSRQATQPAGEEDRLIRRETLERLRAALSQLPPSQQEIVRKRVYEEKRFREIAHELQIPLGTALGRMRAALNKLRRILNPEDCE